MNCASLQEGAEDTKIKLLVKKTTDEMIASAINLLYKCFKFTNVLIATFWFLCGN